MFYLLSSDKIVYKSEDINDIDLAAKFDEPSGEIVVKSDDKDLKFKKAKKLTSVAVVERQLCFD